MPTCAACQAPLDPGARFCPACGAPQGPRCPQCDSAVRDTDRFCPSCGTALVGVGPATVDERKLVTVLFADVESSTELGERLDPERLRALLQSYFTAMRAEIEAEGGTVEKFIGDAVMAAFGVPVAHEDDPARALRAALRMQRRLVELNDDLRRVHGVELAVRIGVNTGDVLASGDPQSGEGLVTGDTVNVAARFEQVAAPGQVVTGERTLRAVRGFRHRLVGDLDLKGKSAPVAVYAVTGEQGGSVSRGLPGLRAPLVGRDTELALLRSVYRRAADERRPHLVTVYGEAGVGKSRLAAEFLSWAREQDPAPVVVEGRCPAYGDGVTYWPLALILKAQAGILDSDSSGVAQGKIRALRSGLLRHELVADPDRTVEALAYTVGLFDAGSPLAAMDGRQVCVELHEAWRVFFSCLAASGPVVALVDDIHWADPALLDLLDALAEQVQGGLVLLCPARPELGATRPAWGGARRNMSSIGLEPLTPTESAALIDQLVHIEGLPPEVRARILERAEGNPFFLEEIVRHLLDLGQLEVVEGDLWRAVPGIGQVDIPDTVHAALAGRIDLLPGPDKRVLQAASVVGRTFWPGAVLPVLGDALDLDEIDESLALLTDREFIRPRVGSSLAGESEFTFKHVLTRDVAYGSLPRAGRARAHCAVADWLDQFCHDRRAEFVELLAHHWYEAYASAREDVLLEPGWVEKTRLRAYESALAASRDCSSRFVLDRALTLADRAMSLAAGADEQALALEQRGAVALSQYRGDLAWESFKEAADLRAGALTDPLALANACGRAASIPLRWPGSMASVPTPDLIEPYVDLGFASLPPGDTSEAVMLLTARAFLGAWVGPGAELTETDRSRAAEQAGLDGYEMALRLGELELASAALDGAGSVPLALGWFDRVRPILERRLALVDRLGDRPWELGDIYAMSAWVDSMAGRPQQAIEATREFERRLGDARAEGVLLHNLSWRAVAQFTLGEWDDLVETTGPALLALLGDRIQDPPAFSVAGLSHFAMASILQCRDKGAAEVLAAVDRALSHDTHLGGAMDACRARIALLQGRVDDAGRLLTDIARDGLYGWVSRPSVDLARADVLAEVGDRAAAGAFLAEARPYAERAGTRLVQPYLDRLEGRLALSAGDPAAIEALRRSVEGFVAIPAPWEEARTRIWLAEALAARGDLEAARGQLADATPALQRLRAVSDLTRVRDQLAALGSASGAQ